MTPARGGGRRGDKRPRKSQPIGLTHSGLAPNQDKAVWYSLSLNRNSRPISTLQLESTWKPNKTREKRTSLANGWVLGKRSRNLKRPEPGMLRQSFSPHVLVRLERTH
jgi:hypothetical protein